MTKLLGSLCVFAAGGMVWYLRRKERRSRRTLLADLIAARGKFRSKKLLLVSYVVFSYGLTGPILPLWFMKDAYIANLTARGKDAAYIDTLFAPINNGSFVAAMAAILVCAVLGGLFGQRMMKKHFEKAGIVA